MFLTEILATIFLSVSDIFAMLVFLMLLVEKTTHHSFHLNLILLSHSPFPHLVFFSISHISLPNSHFLLVPMTLISCNKHHPPSILLIPPSSLTTTQKLLILSLHNTPHIFTIAFFLLTLFAFYQTSLNFTHSLIYVFFLLNPHPLFASFQLLLISSILFLASFFSLP